MRQNGTSWYRTLLLVLATLLVAGTMAMAGIPGIPMALRATTGNPSGGQPYIELQWASGDSNLQSPSPYHLYQAMSNGQGAVTFTKIADVRDSGSHGYYWNYFAPGVYSFYVTAYNNDGESAPSETVTVRVSAVSIAFNPVTVYDSAYVGMPYTHHFSATASDGSQVVYGVQNVLDGMHFDPFSQTFNWTPKVSGRYRTIITASLASDSNTLAVQYVDIVVLDRPINYCVTFYGTVLYANGDPVLKGSVNAYSLDSVHGLSRSIPVVNGQYEITVQDSVTYRMAVNGGDFYEKETQETYYLPCGSRTMVNFVVTSIPQEPLDSVTGRVTRLSDGAPVMAVLTFVTRDGRSPDVTTTRTDGNGYYTAVLRGSTPYLAYASPLDSALLVQYYDHAATIDAATLFVPSQVNSAVNFELASRPAYRSSVSGTLFGAGGALISGVVEAYSVAMRGGLAYLVYTDQTPAIGGVFTFINLQPGTYVFHGISRDSASAPGFYVFGQLAARGWEDGTQVPVIADNDVTGMEIRLDSLTHSSGRNHLGGTVNGEEGTTKQHGAMLEGTHPLVGVTVYAVDGNNHINGVAVTDVNGHYDLAGLAAGSYTIEFDKVSFRGVRKSFVFNGEDTVADLPATLERAGALSAVPVTAGASASRLMVYPNPARSMVTVGFDGRQGEAVVTMTNITGAEVLSGHVATVDGANRLTIATATLGNGLYFVRIAHNGGVMSIPVTIVR